MSKAKSFLNEIKKSSIGYKIMVYVADTNKLYSMADRRLSIPLKAGYVLGSPSGIWLGSTKKYVQDYYGSAYAGEPEEMEEGEFEMLLSFEYDPNDLMSGDPNERPSLQDSGVEFSVKKATLIHAYNITSAKEEF